MTELEIAQEQILADRTKLNEIINKLNRVKQGLKLVGDKYHQAQLEVLECPLKETV